MKMIHGFNNKYDFLSNFYACDVEYEGRCYKTAEHAYQAAKTLNEEERMFIAAAATPGEAKHRGRQIKIRPDWDKVKDHIMYEIVSKKFKNPDMRYRMISTINEGYDGFCEDNWWHDNYWGNCQCEKCQGIKGQNHLGKILMQVAHEIIGEIIN
jgi:ribA/ribD-fused uncharacterized protein